MFPNGVKQICETIVWCLKVAESKAGLPGRSDISRWRRFGTYKPTDNSLSWFLLLGTGNRQSNNLIRKRLLYCWHLHVVMHQFTQFQFCVTKNKDK